MTVAGGQAEAAMKRVLLAASGPSDDFADADGNWTELARDLQR